MQIKHGFLLSLFIGLSWTGYLFAYVTGPDPGYNGLFSSTQTCATAGCHSGNSVNSQGGSVTVTGLPIDTGWTPGQTYSLIVTIQRPGQRLFGFQLSAVIDGTTQQAGTLAPGSGRVKVICGGNTPPTSTQYIAFQPPCPSNSIQYAEHSNATVVTSSYPVSWTAPASASVGTVKFNVAGNAANGDGNNTGDFIYTNIYKVSPAAGPPPPDLTTHAFTMIDRGGVSVITDGSGSGAAVGYARVQPDANSTTPAGVAIFGLRNDQALFTEAGVPAAVLLTNARIYAENSSNVRTGFAIANPNDQTANINFHFTDSSGADFGNSSFTLPPHQQKARFLDEDPFNVLVGKTSFQGTFTFTSDVQVAAVALRGYNNERVPSEFLITTLPVTDLLAPTSTGTVALPHFAAGGAWSTQIILVNPTDSPLAGKVQFLNTGSDTAAATAQAVVGNGQTASSFDYSIPRQGSFRLSVTAPGFVSGSVRVVPSTGPSPSSLVVFSQRGVGGVMVSEAGVPGINGSAFRMYAEESAPSGIGAVQTTLAVVNLDTVSTTVTLALTTLDGTPIASATQTVPGNAQVARYLHELFPSLTFPFKGVLKLTGGNAAGLSMVGLRLRTNERSEILVTTTPPTNESTPPSINEVLFPQIVNGGGFTTQFILFSGANGQASSGNLKFFSFDGTPLSLTVN
jgi:hypothetical protein